LPAVGDDAFAAAVGAARYDATAIPSAKPAPNVTSGRWFDITGVCFAAAARGVLRKHFFLRALHHLGPMERERVGKESARARNDCF